MLRGSAATPQIVRDWVVRFNARGAEGLIAGHAGGSASKLTNDHRRTVAKMIDDGPDPVDHQLIIKPRDRPDPTTAPWNLSRQGCAIRRSQRSFRPGAYPTLPDLMIAVSIEDDVAWVEREIRVIDCQ